MPTQTREATKLSSVPRRREPTPRSFGSASVEVARMRKLMQTHEQVRRDRDESVAELEARIATIKKRAGGRLATIEQKLEPKARSVYRYLENNRATLTPKDSKTIKFELDAYGSWRSDSFVDILDEAKLLAELQKLKFDDCFKIEYTFYRTPIRKRLEAGTILDNALIGHRERFHFKFDGIESTLVSEVNKDSSRWSVATPDSKKKKAS